MMLYAAFAAFFGSLIAVGVHWAGMPLAAAIRAGSALLLLSTIYGAVTVLPRLRRLDPVQAATFSLTAGIAIGSAGVLSLIAQSIVVANVFPDASRGLFFYGLLNSLGLAAFLLVRILFIRPGNAAV